MLVLDQLNDKMKLRGHRIQNVKIIILVAIQDDVRQEITGNHNMSPFQKKC